MGEEVGTMQFRIQREQMSIKKKKEIKKNMYEKRKK
jgi:hypothetical protein